jgi:hypothetical protein
MCLRGQGRKDRIGAVFHVARDQIRDFMYAEIVRKIPISAGWREEVRGFMASVARTRRRNQDTKRGTDQDSGGESGARISGDVVVCHSSIVAKLGGGGAAMFSQRALGLRHGCFDSVA